MIEHTKLPWKTNKISQGWIQDTNGILVASAHCYNLHSAARHISAEQMAANAEYIVQACNSHKTMRTALEYVLEVINNDEHPWWMTCPDKGGFDVEKIEAAIAAANPEQKSGSKK